MPKVRFVPADVEVEVDAETKLLLAALRNKVEIRYGCASCRCGTCGVKITRLSGTLKAMRQDETDLLSRMGLPLDGSVRLACQARIMEGEVEVDLAFQNQYSPDDLERLAEDEAADESD